MCLWETIQLEGMGTKCLLLTAASLLLTSPTVSARTSRSERNSAMAQAQASAMINDLGGGNGNCIRGRCEGDTVGWMPGSVVGGMSGSMAGGMSGSMASGMAGGMSGGMAGGMAGSMASGMVGGYGGMTDGYGVGTGTVQAQAQAMTSTMGGMGIASASASVTMGGLQNRWNSAQAVSNDAMSRVANFIAKIEEIILGLPLTVIKAMMGIPIKVVDMAISMAQSITPLLHQAKSLLCAFFQTVFELTAKSLYGTISIFVDLVQKILEWGQTCHGSEVCSVAPPNIGGFGPCGGRWPCTRVVGCQSVSCFSTARALGGREAYLDNAHDL
ncbi:hypothetical protein GE061_008219 [Apolygus lucorum]|uniref:Uncharacterized protein n=1 Tax=Apolygus lucorum TaxID=248454 RepID=A0A8S9WQQ0_APOLU|nr:hypothetical protein GE061_008219 [Apolygus lucorum]